MSDGYAGASMSRIAALLAIAHARNLGWLLIAVGAIMFLRGNGSVITAFLGWFVLTAARQDAVATRARAAS